MADLEANIEELWERLGTLSPSDTAAAKVVTEAIGLLDGGEARVAETDPLTGETIVHEWLKKAILLFFRLRSIETMEVGPFEFADKLPLKHDFAEAGVRVVPGASARWGSYLAPGVVLMPSYVNIGARVGADSMVDTWATWDRAPRSGLGCTCRAAWASVACSSRRTPCRWWSRTTR
jgi:2,3,4,5-tetrahydropyridine-2-carboxylate N-succinyltransferase